MNDETSVDNAPFLLCCQTGDVKCLEYLLSVQENFEAKLDVFCTSKTNGDMNGLQIAIDCRNVDMVKFLLNNVYNDDSMNEKNGFDINSIANGLSVLHCSAMLDDDVTVLDALFDVFKDKIDVNIANKQNITPIIIGLSRC